MSNHVAGTVTVLFTDMVASTSTGQRLGEERAQALRRAHDRLLTQAFQDHGGTVVKGTGDGFMVSFPSARQAVDCGVAIQQAIQAQHAQGRYPDLEVKIGIHTGEPTQEGDDLFGSDVTLSARIVGEAKGGQVIISEVTRLLASHGSDLTFESIGERDLKGFAEPVRLFRAVWTEDALRPAATRFIGREEQLSRLRGLLDQRRGFVLVAGEPGVGKTRLLSEIESEARDRNFITLLGRAYDTEGMPAYLPFIEALSAYASGQTADRLQADLGDATYYIAKLVPQIRDVLQAVPESPPASAGGERYWLFEAVTNFLARIASTRPVLLLLDDLHWADEATILLLEHALRRLADHPVAFAGAYRAAELNEQHPLARLLARTAAGHPQATVPLQPLDREETSELITAAAGTDVNAKVVDALFNTSRGNPLFVEGLVRHLREQHGDLDDADLARGVPVPESLRMFISGWLSRLPGETQKVLRQASVFGNTLAVPLVAAVVGCPPERALDVLDEALSAGVLREEAGGYTFSHPLIHEALYGSLSAPRKRHLHRVAGEAIEELHGDALESLLPDLAHHFSSAHDRDVAAKASRYSELAAEQAMELFAYEEAFTRYQAALRALELERLLDRARAAELLLKSADALYRGGEGAAASDTYLKVADMARELEEPEVFARAVIGLGDTRRSAGFVDRELLNLIERALLALPPGDSALRARLLAIQANHSHRIISAEEAVAQGEEAVQVARRVGDRAALVQVMASAHFSRTRLASFDRRIELATELIDLARSIGDRETELLGRRARISDLLAIANVEGARREVREFSEIATEIHQPFYLWYARLMDAMLALQEGRLDDADSLIRQAFALGRSTQSDAGLALQFAGLQTFLLRKHQGRLVELEDVIRPGEQPDGLVYSWEAAAVLMYAETGNPEAASRYLSRLAIEELAAMPDDDNRDIAVAFLAEACFLLDEAERASQLYELLATKKGACITAAGVVGWLGSTDRFLGLLATTRRDWPAAEQHLACALDVHQRTGARPWLAHTMQEYGEMLLCRCEPGDDVRALRLLRDAKKLAGELGMQGVAARSAQLMEGAPRDSIELPT